MAAGRLASIDILRALAMLWMTVYHFCYDLDYFGLIDANFTRDPFWYAQRTAIVGLFVFTAGFSQAVAWRQGQGWPRFWRRWVQVAGAALLVTVGSALVFPDTFIYFGILHGMAAMLIVARLTAEWGRWLWLAGALAIAAKFAAPLVIGAWPTLAFLNLPGWNVLGLVSRLPATEDYVPLLPWLGGMWWGLAAGQWVLRCRPQWLTGEPGGGVGRGLTVLGRWSLSYYLLHQPVMMGLIALVLYLTRTG